MAVHVFSPVEFILQSEEIQFGLFYLNKYKVAMPESEGTSPIGKSYFFLSPT